MKGTVSFDTATFRILQVFERATRVAAKDCIPSRTGVLFIVGEGSAAKALGARAANAHRLQQLLKRKIKIVEFSDNIVMFLENLIYPVRGVVFEQRDCVIVMKAPDFKVRGELIGRNGSRLRTLEAVAKRHFQINEIKVM